MSRLMQSEEITVESLFDKKIENILIPVYQRPYRWEKEQCEQLWDDVLAIDDDNKAHFLGSVVAYKNGNILEIIDGQQRITTITLFARALLEMAKNSDNNEINKFKKRIAKCIFKVDEADEIDFTKPILKSEVALDDDLEEFKKILDKETDIKNLNKSFKSNYILNCKFFFDKLCELSQEKTLEFNSEYKRILLNLLEKCEILRVVCENQDSAMRIFNTLNNRGMPLSNSDIFKGIILQDIRDNKKYVKDIANIWKELEKLNKNNKGGIDFLFQQYLFVVKAINQDDDTTVGSTLKFFSQDKGFSKVEHKYSFPPSHLLLGDKIASTLAFLENLSKFWHEPYDYLDESIYSYFMVLENYINEYWKIPISVTLYKICNGSNIDFSNTSIFNEIVPKLLVFVMVSFLNGRGTTSSLKTQLFKTNVDILQNKKDISFLLIEN